MSRPTRSRKKMLSEHIIPDLADIAFDYARKPTVDDVLQSALKYLITSNPSKKPFRGAVLAVFSSQQQHKKLELMIHYEEKDCDNCGGAQGCFSVFDNRRRSFPRR